MPLLLNLFIFASWALGLLAALLALSMKLQEHNAKMRALNLELESDSLDVAGKKNLFDRIVSKVQNNTPSGIPEELKKLMTNSPGHPEVNEIEDGDEVVGILFKASSYPPGLDEDDVDDEPNTQSGPGADKEV
jgi:hypothetical protein